MAHATSLFAGGDGDRLPRPRRATDFLTAVTATFKYLYVFVVIELGTRKLLHINVTDHPTVAWIPSTAQRNHTVGPSVQVVVYFLAGKADPGFREAGPVVAVAVASGLLNAAAMTS